ncbi:MAG TPA: tetratricopeptide repeat protein [Thiobacillaceae bacterium]|nr:tetratricopeptide repeat protein [Thiobacillaceae bacterium]HNU64223.1 tetratricopeptide repeat protein [Thiobacillaceae bacterium]
MRETLSPWVFDASPDNFESLVQGNSMKGLVLVHFWTPKAGPCMLLMPRLVRLAAAYGGRFLLVMADTDVLSRQARSLGVTSVPTVKFFLHGQVVHTVHGAEPDGTFHEALQRYLATPRDGARMAALALHQQGDTAAAIEQLACIAVEHPGDLAVSTDLAKLLTLAGRPEEALSLLAALSAEARQGPDIAPLLAHLELIDAARNGPSDADARLRDDPADHDARLALAARALFDDATAQAMEHLLILARTAPDYRGDLGRRAMLALFGMLGSEHPLTRQYRGALASLHA